MSHTDVLAHSTQLDNVQRVSLTTPTTVEPLESQISAVILGASASSPTLPFGWEERRTPAGCPYYADHLTGTVYLAPPEGRRQAFLSSQHGIPANTTSLPKYKPPVETYDDLIDQFISIYRSLITCPYREPLLQLLLGPEPRDLSEGQLLERLEPLLRSSLSLETKELIGEILFKLATETRGSSLSWEETELMNSTLTVVYVPAPDVHVAASSDSPSSSSVPSTRSSTLPSYHISLKKSHAWCYICQMDFDEAGRSSLSRAMGGGSLGERLRLRLCGHVFHAGCFYFYTRHESTLCPLCPNATSNVSSSSTSPIETPETPQSSPPGAHDIVVLGLREDQDTSRSEPPQTCQISRTTDSHELQKETNIPSEVAAQNGLLLPPGPLEIVHPLCNDTEELSRLRELAQQYTLGLAQHREREQAQLQALDTLSRWGQQQSSADETQERTERAVVERDMRHSRKLERHEVLKAPVDALPLMLYIPAPTSNLKNGEVGPDESWEDNWEKADLPYLPLDEDHAGCYICLSEFKEPRRRDRVAGEENEEEPEPIRLLPCGHVYHQACVDQWLLDEVPNCPYCRRSILPDPGILDSPRSSQDSPLPYFDDDYSVISSDSDDDSVIEEEPGADEAEEVGV